MSDLPASTGWTSCDTDVLGRTEPRLWTPPLRELTEDTSYGFELIDFAQEIGWPLDPWECWLAIHMGELLPDGRPRFRMVLALVARQNGKTTLCRVLTLWWLHVQGAPMVLGTSTSRDSAKESWRAVADMAMASDVLGPDYGPKALRETIGEECLTTLDGARYRFAAPNRRAGRSWTVHRLILDELREHSTWETYKAAVKAMTAVADAQAVAITNQGDSTSVVLDSLRDAALAYIETGQGDPRLGLFEWSAPAGSRVTDPEAIAYANPNLGRRILLDSLIGDALRAEKNGGEELTGFKTETLCMRVTLLNPAIDETAWNAAGVDPADALDLAEHRRRVALCLDVSLDGTHATLVAAATIDGTTHLDVVKAWSGFGCTKALRRDLPGIVAKIRPRTIGWFPDGPAAAVAASMKNGDRSWPPRRVTVQELKAETDAVCMGFAEQVQAGEVRHARDPLLTKHVTSTQKLTRGPIWVFTRGADEPIDATYAAAGAVHLARTLPSAPPPLVVLPAGG